MMANDRSMAWCRMPSAVLDCAVFHIIFTLWGECDYDVPLSLPIGLKGCVYVLYSIFGPEIGLTMLSCIILLYTEVIVMESHLLHLPSTPPHGVSS